MLQDAGIDEVWHLAGLQRCEPAYRDVLEALHVGGTERLIDLARVLGVRAFHHFSTAHVVGTRPGLVPEERYDPAFPTNNFWEETKRRAEDLVLAARDHEAFEVVRVFRPSLIAGSSPTGDACGRTGLNGLLAVIDRFKTEMDEKVPGYLAEHPLRLLAGPGAVVDLVPVDRLVQEAVALARGGSAETFFHLTDPFPLPLQDLLTALSEAFPGLRVERVEDESALRPADVMFRDRLQFYLPYLQNERTFERRRDQGRPDANRRLSGEEVRRYATKGVERLHRDQSKRSTRAAEALAGLQKHSLRCRFGEELEYYTHGEGPAVVLINAYGVSVECWKEVIAGLVQAGGRRLITWDCRGCSTGSPERTYRVADHVADLQEILDREDVTHAHLIGWCTGAKVAVEFAARHPEQTASVTTITGAFGPLRGVENLQTRYDQAMAKICFLVSRRPEMAPIMLRAVTDLFGKPGTGREDADTRAAEMMLMVSPRLLGLITAPFLNAKVIARYARMVADFQEHNVSDLLPQLRVPMLVLGADSDTLVHPDLTAEVVARVLSARGRNLPWATHWCLMEHADDVLEEITTLLHEVESRPAVSTPLPRPVAAP
jgi:pimeloyl-ACP methyl ester carboxylesterase/nucleoside-diphosphate-sugar epimerase